MKEVKEFCEQNYFSLFIVERLDSTIEGIYICSRFSLPTSQSFVLEVQGWEVTDFMLQETDKVQIIKFLNDLKIGKSQVKFIYNYDRNFKIIVFR